MEQQGTEPAQTFEVCTELEGSRLDKFLAVIYPDLSRSFFQKIFLQLYDRLKILYRKTKTSYDG